jgi:hypothetical protein
MVSRDRQDEAKCTKLCCATVCRLTDVKNRAANFIMLTTFNLPDRRQIL